MAGMKEIKKRITSVSDTQKITNAMYLIASTKLRKARQELDATRPYFDSLRTEIKRIFRIDEDIESSYFYPPNQGQSDELNGTYGYLVVTADKGLAGAYNSNVIKYALERMKQHKDNKLYVVGEYGRHYFDMRGIPIEHSFLYTAQNPSLVRANEIAQMLLREYTQGDLSEIYIIYTDMKNGVTQEVSCDRILPFHRRDFIVSEAMDDEVDFEFNPGLEEVLDNIIPGYITGYVYSALVDSFCSEQNARMMAMDSANSNAEELIDQLRLEYNHLRQNAITQEITEVAAGAKAKRKKMEREKQRRKKEEVV